MTAPTKLISPLTTCQSYIDRLDLRNSIPETDKKIQRAAIACSVAVDCIIASMTIVALVLSGAIPTITITSFFILLPLALAGAGKAVQLYREAIADRAAKFNELIDRLERISLPEIDAEEMRRWEKMKLLDGLHRFDQIAK